MQTTMRALVAAAVAAAVAGCTPPAGGGDGGEGGGAGGGGGGGGAADAGPPGLDVVVTRFNADGTLDTSFGAAGVQRAGLSTGTVRDSTWGLTVDSSDRLVVFAASKQAGHTDTDRVVMRFTANGVLDTTFGEQGRRWLDVSGGNDNPRNGFVQADGKIVTSGYTAVATGVGTQTANHVVLQRLDADGNPDPAFGTNGVVVSNPFKPADPVNTQWGIAEAYAVALQNGKYVTAGYGRAAATGTVDAVSFRYGGDGSFDTTWGVNGILAVDLIGADERARNLVAHPDGRLFMVGSGTPTTGQIDAMITTISSNGALDTGFNTTGYKLFDFGRPDEHLFGVALNPTGSTLAAVGYRAGGGEDDDAVLVLLPVQTGAPAEVAKVIPLSETGNDRLLSVAWDSAGRLIATGYVVENGDSKVAVVRLNADGTLDTTFGQNGIASINVSTAAVDEIARGVAIQSSGKIVITGTAERPVRD